MEPEEKKKIEEKKRIDKKYRYPSCDDDFLSKKAKKREFKQKKRQMFEEDSLEELEDYI